MLIGTITGDLSLVSMKILQFLTCQVGAEEVDLFWDVSLWPVCLIYTDWIIIIFVLYLFWLFSFDKVVLDQIRC